MAASGAGGVEAVYDTKHYNLSAIIAVGGEVDSERAVQLRKWATRVVEELTLEGFATSDERLARYQSPSFSSTPRRLTMFA